MPYPTLSRTRISLLLDQFYPGRSEAFKVEYLDQAITIKPLHRGVKSNLYVYTDYRRYNVQLVSGAEDSADFVVYLENPKQKGADEKSGISWTQFSGKLTNESLELKTKRLGRAKNGVLIVEFQLRTKQGDKIKPEWIWLTQNGVTKPIQNLFLSSIELKSNEEIQGVIQILQSDIDFAEPMRLELRRKKTSFTTIPKVATWK